VDISEANPRDPLEDYRILNRELSIFDAALARKPQIVALNKIDLPKAKEKLPEVMDYFQKLEKEVYPISALTGEGIPALLKSLSRHAAKKFTKES